MAGGSWEPHLDLERSLGHKKSPTGEAKYLHAEARHLPASAESNSMVTWWSLQAKIQTLKKYLCLQYSLWMKSPKSIQSPILDAEADALGLGSFFKVMRRQSESQPEDLVLGSAFLSLSCFSSSAQLPSFSNNSSNCLGFRESRWAPPCRWPPEIFRNTYFL